MKNREYALNTNMTVGDALERVKLWRKEKNLPDRAEYGLDCWLSQEYSEHKPKFRKGDIISIELQGGVSESCVVLGITVSGDRYLLCPAGKWSPEKSFAEYEKEYGGIIEIDRDYTLIGHTVSPVKNGEGGKGKESTAMSAILQYMESDLLLPFDFIEKLSGMPYSRIKQMAENDMDPSAQIFMWLAGIFCESFNPKNIEFNVVPDKVFEALASKCRSTSAWTIGEYLRKVIGIVEHNGVGVWGDQKQYEIYQADYRKLVDRIRTYKTAIEAGEM